MGIKLCGEFAMRETKIVRVLLMALLLILKMTSVTASNGKEVSDDGTRDHLSPKTILAEPIQEDDGYKTSFPKIEEGTRCYHLESLRQRHYRLLTATAQLAEAEEEAFHTSDGLVKSRYVMFKNAFEKAASRYEEIWKLVQLDLLNIKDTDFVDMNQCSAGTGCKPGIWDRGCYHCLPRINGILPTSCSYDHDSGALLNLVEQNIKLQMPHLLSFSCIHEGLKEIMTIQTQIEVLNNLLQDSCLPKTEGEPHFVNVYKQAHNLEQNLMIMRRWLEKKKLNLTNDDGDSVDSMKVIDVQLHTNVNETQGVNITFYNEVSCLRSVFIEAMPYWSAKELCWIFKDRCGNSSNYASNAATVPEQFTTDNGIFTPSSISTVDHDSDTITPGDSNTDKSSESFPKCLSEVQNSIKISSYRMMSRTKDIIDVTLKMSGCVSEMTESYHVKKFVNSFIIYLKKIQEILETVTGYHKRNSRSVSGPTFGLVIEDETLKETKSPYVGNNNEN